MGKKVEKEILDLKAKGKSYREICFLMKMREDEIKEICQKREKEEKERLRHEELDKEIEAATMRPWKKSKVM